MNDAAIQSSDSRRHEKFKRLLESAQRHPPVITAIAHPCDEVSLESAVEAAGLKLIVPILVGPTARIQRGCGAGEARHRRLRNRRCGA